MNSDELLAALRRREDWAYRKLYREYAGKIGSIAKAYLGTDDVDDVVQEVMIKVLRNIKKFKGKSKLTTWIYRIAVNVCKDFLSKYRRRGEILTDFPEDEERSFIHPSADTDVFSEAMNSIAYDRLMKAVEKLPSEDRLLVKLRDVDGLSYEEISQVLGKPIGSVKSGLHYARKKLRQMIEGAKQ